MYHNIDISRFKNKKTALVLSGGVVKAASWHLGVALALEEFGFVLKHNKSPTDPDYEISTYVGSSAGSLINLYFASGFRPVDVIDATINGKNSQTSLKAVAYSDMLSRKMPSRNAFNFDFYNPFEGFPAFLKQMAKPLLSVSGLFSTEGLNQYMQKNVIISQDFNEYAADMFVVATQLDHSRKVIFSKYNYPSPIHDSTSEYYTGVDVTQAISASMSVPPFYSPFPVKNPRTSTVDYYIDGEIRETLSNHVAVDNKCDFVISSWTHTPYHFHDEIGSLINYGLPAICMQAIYLMIQKKIVASRSHTILAKDIIGTINDYMTSNNFSQNDKTKITSILERKMNYNPNIKFIDIYPDHSHYKLFFTNSFSLDPQKAKYIMTAGYKKTFEVFKKLEWD
ncbi:MAG: patatin-like phospholipase family protein [Bacteriovorax sp.]|jgi:predicted acylesterase/phospholipase RssA